jgi:hypothetical protein
MPVKDEVRRFRGRFVEVQYSHDQPASSSSSATKSDPLDMDMAGY